LGFLGQCPCVAQVDPLFLASQVLALQAHPAARTSEI
jgi:hypothetical protein